MSARGSSRPNSRSEPGTLPYVTTQTRGAGLWPRLVRAGFALLLGAVVTMWLVEIFDAFLLDSELERHGIRPRTFSGLDGILWAPFLHGSFGHLISNTVPFLILGALVLLGGMRRWLTVTIFIGIVGGLATWLFARSAVHIGASMIIFGYIGYLIVVGFVERSVRGVAISVLVALFYGTTLIVGVLPVSGRVSWEGHLMGAAAGVIAALAVAGAHREDAAT